MARRESGVHGFEPEKKDCGGWNAGEARGSKEPGKEFHAQEERGPGVERSLAPKNSGGQAGAEAGSGVGGRGSFVTEAASPCQHV